MQRFVFAFTWQAPPNVALVEQERAQVARLIEEGRMEQILLAADRSRGWLVLRAASEAEAREAVATLPFYPSMHIEVTPLVPQYP